MDFGPIEVVMRRPRGLFFLAGALLLIGGTTAWYLWIRPPTYRAWPEFPAGTYRIGSREAADASGARTVAVPSFRVQRTEVTVGQFVRCLSQTRPDPLYESPQIAYEKDRYVAIVDRLLPVAYVTLDEAMAYAEWAGRKRGATVRLPYPDEWEIAARGGTGGIRYPWGWAAPTGRAQFDAAGPALVGQYGPNTMGLYDMAGNVAEWCLPTNSAAPTAMALGGSWAERAPMMLRVFQRTPFPRTYRNADVGFRVIEVR